MKTLFLLFATWLFYNVNGQSYHFIFEGNEDLNADGKIDHIVVKQTDQDTFGYKLHINDAEIDGCLGDMIDGFVLIDINKWDKYKEVAVHTPGASSDDIYMIYWYDGSKIIEMNRLSRWPTFLGNGIVYVNGWVDFWSIRDKYKLDNTVRKLIRVEQFAYYVGLKVKVNKGFRIYREKDLVDEVALLSDDSEIEIILCNKHGYDFFDYRYLIKSGSGLLGWTDFKTLEANATLPLAD